ncbi:hypothetical protein SeMB42_g07414 [Synchytrium endobioticum]|uniref:DNA-directed RNA polymerase III subunit n=1 Tax=Synchytrium endobioticum TaxID=286115 RepID=A0A507CP18_9FUNG|nr:hypothetical protein SeMB42_g07414 [Synchytrium endobioticum]TPX40876.1 hypothetical protein SeLEV6574_g06365 [Synchytrium endobioticum]
MSARGGRGGRGGFRGRGSKFGRGRGGGPSANNDGIEGELFIDASLMPESRGVPALLIPSEYERQVLEKNDELLGLYKTMPYYIRMPDAKTEVETWQAMKLKRKRDEEETKQLKWTQFRGRNVEEDLKFLPPELWSIKDPAKKPVKSQTKEKKEIDINKVLARISSTTATNNKDNEEEEENEDIEEEELNEDYEESENEEEGDYLVDHWDEERDEFGEEDGGNEGREDWS